MSAQISTLQKQYDEVRGALRCLVYKIETEEWRGTPLHPKSHPDCPWLKDGGYPEEYRHAREVLEKNSQSWEDE